MTITMTLVKGFKLRKKVFVLVCIILLVATVPASQTNVTVKVQRFDRVRVDNAVFTEGQLAAFESTSSEDCALSCLQREGCVSFIFERGTSATSRRTCYEYFREVTSASTESLTPSSGVAMTFKTNGRKGCSTAFGPNDAVEMTLPGKYNYVMAPPPEDSNVSIGALSTLCFSVMTCNDAHILLSHDNASWTGGYNMYEVVIGGWGNGRSVIRDRREGGAKASVSHRPLSCTEFRRFYVSWKTPGVLEVGSLATDSGGLVYEQTFLRYADPTPFHVNYLYLSGWNRPQMWTIGGCCR